MKLEVTKLEAILQMGLKVPCNMVHFSEYSLV